jgi:acetyl esterase/lipase
VQALLIVVGLLGVLCIANAFAPRRSPLLRVPSFVASWTTVELPLHWMVVVAAVAGVGVAGGGLDGYVGLLGLLLLGLTAAGLVVLALEARRADGTMRAAVAELGRMPDTSASPLPPPARFSRPAVIFPFLFGRRLAVQKRRGITYSRVGGRNLKLDLYMPTKARPGDPRPVVVHFHGGAWIAGDKRYQGLPLLHHMAAEGWVGVNVNYRLSPSATFPDHLIDCKRAVAWVRANISDYGGDPDTICVTGSSAGAQLASLVALTPQAEEYQPGFEEANTRVKAAVTVNGVYDLTNRLGTWPDGAFRRFLEPWVIKGFLDEQPELFKAASPLDQVSHEAPPVLIVHGTRDTLAPVEDARLFAQRLGTASLQPVLYAELPGAQHAFDVLPSIRSSKVIESVERFLTLSIKS